MKLIFCLLLVLISHSVFAKSNLTPYKLGVVIVVDQFRADYLMRFKNDFGKDGYRFLTEGGAYFPLADHELLQNMTCPGHAAILSGAYPYRHGIGMNAWFDRSLNRQEYCVRDDSQKVIGSDGVVKDAKSGISPKNYNATTVGDELKNIDRPSRVVTMSIKDRSAVMLGGKRADIAIWLDDKHCQWVSSQYYLKDQPLPSWVNKTNASLVKFKNEKETWGPYKDISYCSRESLQTPWAIDQTFKLALNSVRELKLGKGADVDLLAISLSSHDYLGHKLGPNNPFMKEMTIAEDKIIGQFLKDLAKEIPGGLSNVFVVLTGDHGMPPTPSSLPAEKIPNGNIDEDEVRKIVEDTLTQEWGKPKGGAWVQDISELQFYINRDAMKSAGVSIQKIGALLREKLTTDKVTSRYIDQVWVRDDILFEHKLPQGDLGKIADRTLTTRSGDIILLLKPFFFSDSYSITHMTHYSYDRYVPLVLWGKTFKPGVYKDIARIIDLAPTLSTVLGTLPPAQSEGRVMSEILR